MKHRFLLFILALIFLSSCVSKKKFQYLRAEQEELLLQMQDLQDNVNVTQEQQLEFKQTIDALEQDRQQLLSENEQLRAEIARLEEKLSTGWTSTTDPGSSVDNSGVLSKLPKSSGKFSISNEDVVKGFPDIQTFNEIGKLMSRRLASQGYKDHIFYIRLPHGFAIVTDLEQIKDPEMGVPMPGAQRWSRVLPRVRYFDNNFFDGILESLVGRQGFFRFMMIVVSDDIVSESAAMINISAFDELQLFSEPEFDTWDLPMVSGRTFAKVFVYQYHAQGNNSTKPIASMHPDAVKNNLLNSGLTNVFKINIFARP